MNIKFRLTRKSIYVILSVLICTAAVCFIDTVIQPGYWIKSGIKVLLFLLAIGGYFIINKDELSALRALFIPKKWDLFKGFGIGIAIFAFLLGAYFLLRGYIDFSVITGKLTADTGVSRDNFLYVSLYISVVNSLLEELFFRGLSFIILRKSTSRLFAYIFSAFMFAFYHSGMTSGYFNVGIFLFTLFGLFVGGLIFNFLNDKSETIYASWLTHMFANLGINTIGMILFGML
ncbi:MAG: CPBP family intramembrane metalloprotease [Clostridia bacterium]|nr:CPBP family intramembrane metalloprotease [Clostridia bacterium]